MIETMPQDKVEAAEKVWTNSQFSSWYKKKARIKLFIHLFIKISINYVNEVLLKPGVCEYYLRLYDNDILNKVFLKGSILRFFFLYVISRPRIRNADWKCVKKRWSSWDFTRKKELEKH